jgi:hypothetical protein
MSPLRWNHRAVAFSQAGQLVPRTVHPSRGTDQDILRNRPFGSASRRSVYRATSLLAGWVATCAREIHARTGRASPWLESSSPVGLTRQRGNEHTRSHQVTPTISAWSPKRLESSEVIFAEWFTSTDMTTIGELQAGQLVAVVRPPERKNAARLRGKHLHHPVKLGGCGKGPR